MMFWNWVKILSMATQRNGRSNASTISESESGSPSGVLGPGAENRLPANDIPCVQGPAAKASNLHDPPDYDPHSDEANLRGDRFPKTYTRFFSSTAVP